MTLTLPLYVTLPRKTKADKKISVGLNWYRNAQHYENNDVKKLFKQAVNAEVLKRGYKVKPLGRVKARYTFYFARKSDTGNFFAIIEKFLLDALVEMGFLHDDNCEFVIEGAYTFGGYDRVNPRVEVTIEPI